MQSNPYEAPQHNAEPAPVQRPRGLLTARGLAIAFVWLAVGLIGIAILDAILMQIGLSLGVRSSLMGP